MVSLLISSLLFCDLQETHILHEFPSDFYGSDLAVVITGYVRPQESFGSLGE